LNAQTLSDEDLDSLFNKFLEVRNPALSPEISGPIKHGEDYEKCGLGLVNYLAFNFERLTDEQQLLLKPLLQRPVTSTSFVTSGGYFRVHYDETGPNAPGYDLNLLADALDSTYRFEIDFLGYNIPPGDSVVDPGQPPDSYGGDNRYDVYIGNIGRIYGYTQYELEVELGSGRFTSYMHIHNSFAGFYSTGINGARVTVAHEFHHAIQGGNYIYPYDDVYFYEITSTAMEEFVFDDVNDYYDYMKSYFNNPSRPFVRNNVLNGDGYDIAIWNIFLEKTFDNKLIKRQWELMPRMRAISAINNSLVERGTSFKKEFNQFAIWMFYTNYRAIQGKYFEEAANYPLVKPISVVDFTPPYKGVEGWSNATSQNYVLFDEYSGDDSLVAIISNGDVQNALGDLNTTFNYSYTLYSDSANGDRYLTPNYSSDFDAENFNWWSVSEILNNLLVREDTTSYSPLAEANSFAFPNPFVYEKNFNRINIAFNGNSGDIVDFKVYSLSMDLVHSSSALVGPLVNNSLGITWNVPGENSGRLASGVYIYVIKKGDDVVKGKVIIFN
jgi:hypothetical protein